MSQRHRACMTYLLHHTKKSPCYPEAGDSGPPQVEGKGVMRGEGRLWTGGEVGKVAQVREHREVRAKKARKCQVQYLRSPVGGTPTMATDRCTWTTGRCTIIGPVRELGTLAAESKTAELLQARVERRGLLTWFFLPTHPNQGVDGCVVTREAWRWSRT